MPRRCGHRYLDYRRELEYQLAVEQYNRAVAAEAFRAWQAEQIRLRKLAATRYFDRSMNPASSGSCYQSSGCCQASPESCQEFPSRFSPLEMGEDRPNLDGSVNRAWPLRPSFNDMVDPYDNSWNAAERTPQLKSLSPRGSLAPEASRFNRERQESENPRSLPSPDISTNESLPRMELPPNSGQPAKPDSSQSDHGHDHAGHSH